MDTKKFFMLLMIMFMLFTVSGCGGSGGNTQNFSNDPISPDNPAPIHEPKSDDITIIPEPSPLSQDKPVSQEPIPIPIISHDPMPTPTLYTVTFNTNGGSAVSSITVSAGNTVTKPNDPSKYGYTFDGWYMDSALTQVFRFGSNGDKVTENITLYAKWIETDMLRAEIAIGKLSIGYQDSDNANSVTKNLTLPTSVNVSGDVNVSWSSNAPSVISNSGIVTRPNDNDVVVSLTAIATIGSISRNKTFTVTVLHEAIPAPSGYTVTFNSNGGSAVASFHTSSGGTVIMPENPVREGYVFAGWYKDEAFTEIFTFGADGDKITKDTTLYAQWLDEYLLIAEYSASKIAIGYANGDGSKHVTKNLALPAKIDSADIIWVSSSGAISSNGTVTRQDNDVDVTLTATATYNGKSAEAKTFNVKVIRKRISTSTDIKIIDIQDLVSQDLEIEYNESGDRVTDIDGNFSDMSIGNADDALDAIYSVSGVLGIDNPYEELEVDGSNISKYTSVYSFAQVHDGVKIYGRYVTLGADKNNTASYLSSNLISSYLLDNVKPAMAKLTQSQAEQIISVDYSHVDVMETEQIIFSLYDYEIAPVYAWKIVISGTKSNGSYEDETVFINAENNTIIQRYTNIENAFLDKEINGSNELRKVVNFPLGFRFLKGYYMEDKDLKLTMYSGDFSEENIIGPVDTSISYQDPHQISAYTNMREVMKWWKASFDRDSLDDNGMEVKVLTHNRWGTDDITGDILKDNAAWYRTEKVIVICDNSDASHLDRTMAAALDVITHETGHAVMQFKIGQALPSTKLVNQENITHSINLVAIKEAYADIFGFAKTYNWLHASDLYYDSNTAIHCNRNAQNPSDPKSRTRISSAVLNATTAAYEGHQASLIITHAAYLMHQDGLSKQYGLTWDEFAQLWYQSLQPNAYTPTSTFLDVRKNVMRAARALNLPDNKVKNIEKAFREVGIYDDTPKLCLVSGLITDFETKLPISRATVSVMKETEYDFETIHETETNLIGMFLLIPPLKEGRYAVNVFADGYINFRQEFTITDSAKFILNVPMIKDGKGSIKGYVCASNKNNPLENVTVNIRRGWYEKGDTTGYIWASVVTKADGSFSFNLGENGADYYMLEMIKSGYQTSYSNLIIKGDVTEHYEYMSKANAPVPIDKEHFPDDYFRAYISKQFDRDNDGILSETEIANVTEIHVSNSRVSSLHGVEYFKALQVLYCSGNPLTALDLSDCTALRYLECDDNQLTALDLSSCNALEYLYCSYNDQLTTLDLSGCTALQYLDCVSNQLTVLDLSGCVALIKLYCMNNQLTVLDLSGCTALESLSCVHNQLTVLDLSSCTALEYLYCNNNQLTALNLSDCTALRYLECYDNKLTVLDLSGCVALIKLYCNNNQLTVLDLSECVALTELSCTYNQLITLDISGYTTLKHLDCNNNKLTNLNVKGCTSIKELYCNNNQLATLDLSGCTALLFLECENNQLTTLNLSGCTALEFLSCQYNQLTALDLSDCTALLSLECYDNKLTALDLSNCPNLNSFNVYCDEGINIIWHSSIESTNLASNASQSGLHNANSASEVLAILPVFTPSESGTYIFTISLDRTVSEDSLLVLLDASENLNGSFALTESLNTVIVSADFTAGRTYAPVIVAKTEEQEQSGGCNFGTLGMVLLMVSAVLLKKRRS